MASEGSIADRAINLGVQQKYVSRSSGRTATCNACNHTSHLQQVELEAVQDSDPVLCTSFPFEQLYL
jgi:hypothetical protein